ncbi:MAG: hypothetical protein H6815_07945 [Phycisphaeraceae bacterium]|nr:hypothetical protein [Phycisphaerales bacterium]MCB9860372.1 hypothetical protein [Phycisphaeraceae bacterium]
MKSVRILTVFSALAIGGPCVVAQMQTEHTKPHETTSARPINAVCPVSGEPIDGKTLVNYKKNQIGFCCPGCDSQFNAWTEQRKDEFVNVSLASHVTHNDNPTDQSAWTEPFALSECPVSGQKLGSMGDPIVQKYDGREVRFCCAGCIETFEADTDAYWKKADELIIKDQLRYYPIQQCIVSGEPLIEHDKDIAKNIVYGNRLVRLCCSACETKFNADPAKFIERLNKKTAEIQRKDYPLDTCVVAGGKLGSMGEPTEMVIAGRLLRFCCAGCEPEAKNNPLKYIMAVDGAWQKKNMYVPKMQSENPHGVSESTTKSSPDKR